MEMNNYCHCEDPPAGGDEAIPLTKAQAFLENLAYEKPHRAKKV
jgi:hypothetical protein